MKIFFFVLALILAVVSAGLVRQGAPVVPIKKVIAPVVTKPVAQPSPVAPVVPIKKVITPVVTKPVAHPSPVAPVVPIKKVITPVVTKPVAHPSPVGAYQG